MTLSDVATDVEVTTEQHEHGVAVTDTRNRTLAARLAAFTEELPCGPATAATIVRARLDGGETITASAHEAGVARMTARKVLYRLGEPAAPSDTAASEAVTAWLEGDCSHVEAVAAAGDRTAFALAAYAATHDPIPGASRVVADALSDRNGVDALADARSSVGDLL